MNNSRTNDISKELDEVIIDLLIHEPFFGRLLAKSVKVMDTTCFGVSLVSINQETVQLIINPEYWQIHLKSTIETQTLCLRKSVLKKQVVHFIFNHDSQIHDFENKEIFILSAELVANQYLQNVEEIDRHDPSSGFS